MHTSATGTLRNVGFDWHNRSVNPADAVGAFIFAMPVCLGVLLMTRSSAVEAAMYGSCALLLVPFVGPFAASVSRTPANLSYLALFATLILATVNASLGSEASVDWLNAKGLAATVAWASIYIVVFCAVGTPDGVVRIGRWLNRVCIAITLSVYASALFNFGEVIVSRSGAMRAFGPLGDQVSFVIVLPALMSLAAGRPVLFGLHLVALLLTATRGATVIFVVGVVFYLVLVVTGRIPVQRRRFASAIGAIALGGLVWMTPLSTVLMDRWSSQNFRMTSIDAGIKVIEDHPLTGVGFNGFERSRSAVVEDWQMPLQAKNGLSRVSSQYLQTGTDGGIPALVLLVFFAGFTIRNAYRVVRWSHATPELVGAQVWLVAMLAANHSSLWVLSNTASGFFMFAVAGLAASGARFALPSNRTASHLRTPHPSRA